MTALLTGAIAFVACDKRDMNEPSGVEEKVKSVKVEGEAYLLEVNGDLTPISLSELGLRSASQSNKVESEKGSITGLGEYNTGDKVVVKAERKSPYQLYTLYAEGNTTLTKEKGQVVDLTGFSNDQTYVKVKDVSCQITFNVEKDTKFIAVFTAQGTSATDKSYEALANVTWDNVDGNTTQRKTYLQQGFNVYSAMKSSDGRFVSWKSLGNQLCTWSLDEQGKASWLTVVASPERGDLNLTVQPYISKTEGPRTTSFKITMGPKYPGSNVAATPNTKAERTYTVTQNSYYAEATLGDPDLKFKYGDGSVANIPPTVSASFLPKGETKNLKDADKSFKTPIQVEIPEYVNGQKRGTVTKEVTVEFGNPSNSNITKGSPEGTYTAKPNRGRTDLTSEIPVTFKVDGKVVKNSTIKTTQKPIKYVVSGEIQ